MTSSIARFLAAAILMLAVMDPARAADDDSAARPVKELILPGDSFLVAGHPAFVLMPAVDKRRNPQPWIMYAPTLPGLPDQHEKWMHEQFLDAGVAVAGIDVGEAYGSPAGQQGLTDLYRELTEQRGFATKPCLLGRSRGGLWVSSWAIHNPDKLAGIAGIYPVFDLRTYPGLDRAAPAYGLTLQELEAELGLHNPIARMDALAKVKLPVFIIHGDVDKVVPLQENSATLLERYKLVGAEDAVDLVVVEGQGHNFWPGFFHCQNLVDFAAERANAGAGIEVDKSKKQLASASSVRYKDLEYARVGDKPLQLDLYRPRHARGRLPVIIWVHGGGWMNGSKDRCPASWLTEHGYAVASINYRLTDEAQWPAQIDDCRAAVRWLRSNADAYGLDGDHIAAWGSSAGGHLVALLGTLDAPSGESVSSRVQAVCDWFGPTDLLTMPPNVLAEGRTLDDIANSNGAKLLGGTVQDRQELAKQASALYQVSLDDAPFLIMHGDQDPGVPLEQSKRLHKELTAAGVASILHIVKGAGHGGKEFQTPEVQKIVLNFFDKHLRAADRIRQMEQVADLALVPPILNTSPLPQYDYDKLDYGMTIGIERTPGGRLWACWVAGGDSPKAFFVLSTSDDDGETWSSPRLVADSHSKDLPAERSILVGNLWTDPLGRLWLIFDQSMDMFDGRAGVWAAVCDNPDSEQPTWSEPRRIWHGVTLNKPTVLSSGEWMLPISLDQRPGFGQFKGCFKDLDPLRGANVFVSTDQGVTWQRRGCVQFPNPDWHEHMIVERKDGTLWMLARTAKGIMQTTSSDGGRTWAEPSTPPGIRQPNARFHIRRLASGRLLLVKHGDAIDSHQGRVMLSAWSSDDDGQSWKGGLVLDERPGISYPDGFQAPDGTLYISYDRNRSTDGEILLARFNEDDILAGKLVGPKSKLKMLICRPLAGDESEPNENK